VPNAEKLPDFISSSILSLILGQEKEGDSWQYESKDAIGYR
jgi:hypothetical protein